LGNPQDYWYLRQSNTYHNDDMDDAKEFMDTTKAMDVVGIKPDEKREILRIVAAILHLGNIEFVDAGADNSDIKNMQGKFST
jgi:myosin V